MEALVIGGAGFVGSVLSRDLLDRALNVTCVPDLPRGATCLLDIISNDRFQLVKLDVSSNSQELRKLVRSHNYIIHLAALVGTPACKDSSELSYLQNVVSVNNI